MAQQRDRRPTRLGDLLKQRGLVRESELSTALRKQRHSGDSLGSILVRSGHISVKELFLTLACQRFLRLASLIGTLILAPATAWADSNYARHDAFAASGFTTPTTDHPPVYEGEPISVPVKALLEKWAFGVTEADYAARKFRYDIDTLGQGMAVRMRFKF